MGVRADYPLAEVELLPPVMGGGSMVLTTRFTEQGKTVITGTAAGDIKIPANANPAQEKQMLLAVANRPNDSDTTFTTGGDVSATPAVDGDTVYFPDRAVHMFPSELSTGLCSLNPHVDRLVHVDRIAVEHRLLAGLQRTQARRGRVVGYGRVEAADA